MTKSAPPGRIHPLCETCGNEDPTLFEFQVQATLRFKVETREHGKLLVTNRFRVIDTDGGVVGSEFVCLICDPNSERKLEATICDGDPHFPRNKIDVDYTPLDTTKFHRG